MLETPELIAAMHADAIRVNARFRNLYGIRNERNGGGAASSMSPLTIAIALALTDKGQTRRDLEAALDAPIHKRFDTLLLQKPPAVEKRGSGRAALYLRGPGWAEFVERWA